MGQMQVENLKFHGPCVCLCLSQNDKDFETGVETIATVTWTACGKVFVQDPDSEPKEVHQFTQGVCEDAPDVPY